MRRLTVLLPSHSAGNVLHQDLRLPPELIDRCVLTAQAAVAERTWFLIRASIATIPRSRSGLTAWASPSAV